MTYQSQRVAYYFFAVAMLLLCLQIVYGFIMAFAHMGYDVLHDYIPFNAARASHNNLLVVWLLCGFMGAAYFIIPDETGRELFSPTLALIQLAGLVVVGVIALAGFHVNWWEGRKFLEIPRPLDYLVVLDVLLFIFNIGMTLLRSPRRTTTSLILFFGLFSAALLYLPGMIDTTNQTMDATSTQVIAPGAIDSSPWIAAIPAREEPSVRTGSKENFHAPRPSVAASSVRLSTKASDETSVVAGPSDTADHVLPTSSLAKTRCAPCSPSATAAAVAPGPSATASTASASVRAFVRSSRAEGLGPAGVTSA